jgi:hypothetical protein
LFVIDAQPLIRWMFSVKLRVVAGPNIQNDLAKLLSGPQNAQGLAGGPQWIAGVDHRPQAMLRHCRQQCGELAGIAQRRALNVRLADENPLQIGGFQKAAKARREFLQLRKCRDRAGSASGRVAVACRVRHGGRGPSPPCMTLKTLAWRSSAKPRMTAVFSANAASRISMVVFRIAIPVLTHEFG